MNTKIKKFGKIALFCLLTFGVWKLGWALLGYRWVEPGHSLKLTKRMAEKNVSDRYADPTKNEKGVLEQMRGPGRHWDLDFWNYEVVDVPDERILAGQVALVVNQIGQQLEPGQVIARPDQKGPQENLLTPGAWRINPFGQEIKKQKAAYIPPGSIGVITRKTGGQQSKGIQPKVLQPGYYFNNDMAQSITRMPIGYWLKEIKTTMVPIEVNGLKTEKPKEGTGVYFPLADGKMMYVDFLVVWGMTPENSPKILDEYGNFKDVEFKVIEPQIVSICKNLGSNLTTQDFIRGKTREEFQGKVTSALQDICKKKNITILIALISNFHPDPLIQTTIQASELAKEEQITVSKEKLCNTKEAALEEAKRKVVTRQADFDGETLALTQNEMETGLKTAAETKAEADKKVAAINKETAEITAQMIKIEGQASADVIEADQKAGATKLQFEIDACGGADLYNKITLAKSLAPALNVRFVYAGAGTFWTNFAGIQNPDMKDLAAKQILQQANLQSTTQPASK